MIPFIDNSGIQFIKWIQELFMKIGKIKITKAELNLTPRIIKGVLAK